MADKAIKRIADVLIDFKEWGILDAELESDAFDNIEDVEELADALESERECYMQYGE